MSDERHRNCHTCERDYAEYLDDDGNSVHHCRRPFAAQAWLEATPIDDIGMPPTETEPCPGWEAKEVDGKPLCAEHGFDPSDTSEDPFGEVE